MLVSPAVAVVIAFAAYRVARGIATDDLFDGWRYRLEVWAYDDPDGEKLFYRPVTRRGALGPAAPRRPIKWLTILRGKFADLMTCPLCIGFHASWIALCVWTTTWPWDLGWKGWTLAFGIAGLQALITGIDGYERKKDEP